MPAMSKDLRGMVLTALLCVACPTLAQQAPSPEPLDNSLRALIAAHHGKVALYARDLRSGREIAIDADTPVQTASTIKLAILYHAVNEVAAGRAHWDEKITMQNADRVSGSGILPFLDGPLTLTLKDVLTLMVDVSDNTATNLMIDRFGTKAVNSRLTAIGLTDTWLYKKVSKPAEGPMPADQPKFGLGKTTARQMATLMVRIGGCQLNEQPAPPREKQMAACAVALEMLRNQFYRDTIPRYLESMDTSETGGSAIGNKTGSLDHVRADVALVGAKTGPMVLSIFTYNNEDAGWSVDNEGEVAIAKLARAIVSVWSPEGLDGRNLVPGLGLPAVPATAGSAGSMADASH